MKKIIVSLLIVALSVLTPIMSFPICADSPANSITLGNYDVTNKNFPNASGNGSDTYQSIVIMSTTDNTGGIELPTVEGYENKTDLSTDYSKVVNLTTAKTANDIAIEYISKIKFVNESNDKDMSISISLSKNQTEFKTFFFSKNNHYYQYIPFTKSTLNWINTYNEAKGRTYQGRQGYLATITSLEEDLFIYKASAGSVGWLGGTTLNHGVLNGLYYETFETSGVNKWYWACGPEIGQEFYDRNTNTPTNPTDLKNIQENNIKSHYHNWSYEGSGNLVTDSYNGEPNSLGNETCLTTLPFGYGYSTNEKLPKDKFKPHTAEKHGTYSWNNISYDTNDNSDWCPKGYLVEYGNQINGDSNTGDISTDYLSVSTTIYPGKQPVIVPTISSKPYTGQTLTADVDCSDKPYTVTTNAGGIDVGQYDVVLSLTDSTNYKWSDSDEATKTLKFNITKATGLIDVDTATITKTYGETIVLPTATSNFGSVTCNKESTDLVNAGTYTVTYTLDGTDNYTGDTKQLTVVINEKQLDDVSLTISGSYTYDGNPITPTYTVKDGNKELVNDTDYTAELTNNTNASKTAPTVTITLKGNYTGILTKTFTINKAPITPTVLLNSWTQGETAKEPSVTSNPGNGEITYKYKVKDADDSTYTNEKPFQAGKYTIKATIAETDNYSCGNATSDFIIFNSSTTSEGKIETAVVNTNTKIKDAKLEGISESEAKTIVNVDPNLADLKEAINSGNKVIIYTEVEKPSEESKQAFTSMNINETNAVILDINLYGEIVGEANSKKKISDTNGYKTTISITLTAEQAQKINIASNKNYYVLRKHASEIVKIPAILTTDANGNYVFTFETDKFSAYAIYSENKPVTPPGHYIVPNTGVESSNNHSLLKLSSLSLFAIGTYLVIKKKKDN